MVLLTDKWKVTFSHDRKSNMFGKIWSVLRVLLVVLGVPKGECNALLPVAVIAFQDQNNPSSMNGHSLQFNATVVVDPQDQQEWRISEALGACFRLSLISAAQHCYLIARAFHYVMKYLGRNKRILLDLSRFMIQYQGLEFSIVVENEFESLFEVIFQPEHGPTGSTNIKIRGLILDFVEFKIKSNPMAKVKYF